MPVVVLCVPRTVPDPTHTRQRTRREEDQGGSLTAFSAIEPVAIPDSQVDLLTRPLHGVFSTIGADGQPQSSLVWVDFDGACPRINTTLEQHDPLAQEPPDLRAAGQPGVFEKRRLIRAIWVRVPQSGGCLVRPVEDVPAVGGPCWVGLPFRPLGELTGVRTVGVQGPDVEVSVA